MGKELKIATWNISECVSAQWDIRKGIDENNDGNQMQSAFNEISKKINECDPDIICFQEFPVSISGRKTLIKHIKRYTKLKHYAAIDTCPSFLFKGGRIGIAIFSKKKIKETDISYFVNPHFTKVSKSGAVYKSFDKGIITAKLKYNKATFFLVTGHAIGFSPFDEIAEDHPESYAPVLEKVIELNKRNCPIIVVGDFNTEYLFDILPELKSYVEDKLEGQTTPSGLMEGTFYPNGRKLDNFLVSPQVNVIDIQKIDNFSDHYYCQCRCSFVQKS